MPPPATAAARRPSPRPRAAPPLRRRPPLAVIERLPRRQAAVGAIRRSTMWVSVLLIVGSLLAVVVGDALVTQGQVSLSNVDTAVAAAQLVQKSDQVEVAEKSAPPVVVAQAKSQGLVAPSTVVYLPQVPLDVPLPVPQTAPLPASR
jgi:hypothetical protein